MAPYYREEAVRVVIWLMTAAILRAGQMLCQGMSLTVLATNPARLTQRDRPC